MEYNVEKSGPVYVPYVVHCDTVAHDRWIIKRLVVALIVCIALMFASNGLWLYVWNQYDYSSEDIITTVDSEGDGIANYTGGNGGVNYGAGNSTQAHEGANP